MNAPPPLVEPTHRARARLGARDRAVRAGQADRGGRARVAPRPVRHRQARVEREPARPEPEGRRGDRRGRGGRRRAIRTAARSRLRIALSRAGSASRPTASCFGNGSNDILELVAQAFLKPGDEAVCSKHAFAVYPLATQARGATLVEAPARGYAHDLDAMRAAITPRTRVVFVANPNNPTGTWIARDRGRRLRRERAARRRRRARRGLRRVPRPGRALALARLDRPPSEPRRLAHVLEGLRPRGAAHRLRRDGSAARRPGQPRPPALQRQRARAGGGDRRAARPGLRRGERDAEPRRPAAGRGRRRAPRLRDAAVERQLRARARRRRRARLPRAARAGRDRAAGRELRPARVAARDHRPAGGERHVPLGARARAGRAAP